MSASVDRFDERARREADRVGANRVHSGELLRHPVYTRVLHWVVAIAFVLSLLSGFGIYSPWLFRFLTPIFGGGPMTRFLHPWFALFFDIFFLFQFLNWFTPMAWTGADSVGSSESRRTPATRPRWNRKTSAFSTAARNFISGPSL
jgi:hypothetical protein